MKRKLEAIDKVNFEKGDGLVPAVIQDVTTNQVLMLGYMNKEALEKTLSEKRVTFFSRSKQRLWTKGETSGNSLVLEEVLIDCDEDTLLLKVKPTGSTCHKGTYTCFEEDRDNLGFLGQLTSVIKDRKASQSNESYTASLFAKGMNKIAQKVGEEAVELVIEAKDDNDVLFKEEAADLLFHYMILLEAKGFSIRDVVKVLEERHK